MRIDYKFRHLEPSNELTGYLESHLGKLEKFELRPLKMDITFTVEKAVRRVDLHVHGQNIELHAQVEADNFFSGIDLALEKMARQLARKKDLIQQRHKRSKAS